MGRNMWNASLASQATCRGVAAHGHVSLLPAVLRAALGRLTLKSPGTLGMASKALRDACHGERCLRRGKERGPF